MTQERQLNKRSLKKNKKCLSQKIKKKKSIIKKIILIKVNRQVKGKGDKKRKKVKLKNYLLKKAVKAQIRNKKKN